MAALLVVKQNKKKRKRSCCGVLQNYVHGLEHFCEQPVAGMNWYL
jgi:hypothetical protein